MVGMSGAALERSRDVTAKAVSLPSRASGSALRIFANDMVRRPAMRSGNTAVVPR